MHRRDLEARAGQAASERRQGSHGSGPDRLAPPTTVEILEDLGDGPNPPRCDCEHVACDHVPGSCQYGATVVVRILGIRTRLCDGCVETHRTGAAPADERALEDAIDRKIAEDEVAGARLWDDDDELDEVDPALTMRDFQ